MTASPNAANAGLVRRIWRGFIGQFNWSGAWRTYIETYAEAIDADADRAHAHGARDADRVLALVRVATAQARALAWNWPGLVDWLTGRSVNGAWAGLHLAETQLLHIQSEDQVLGRLPDVLSTVAEYLAEHDPLRLEAERRFPSPYAGSITEPDRELLATALARAYHIRTLEYDRVRRFRNVLIGAVATLLLIMAAVVAVGVRWPSVLSLCTTPQPGAAIRSVVCPTGAGPAPRSGDVPLVVLLGLLGAALAASRAISIPQQRYALAVPLVLLKLPTGMATAMAGLWALNGGFVPGISEIRSQPAMLFWSLIFGYGQQL
ncbi:MAG TPA: hypothetical protein VNW94_27075, partial [Streptosporangiaceae bacterium]|nr:hypothetical protein [Streptosporangiaceae bacterium]